MTVREFMRWFNKCPICGYKLSDCQCLVGGNAHPDR